ncbi:MAG: cyclic pyranopterin monophosphate synthase MoaC [Nitrososphaerota archaeon]
MPSEIRQVNVSGKPLVKRKAMARGFIRLKRETIEKITSGNVEKGDPLQLARIAGTNAAKLTPLLLPLCHPLKLDYVEVNPKIKDDGIEVEAVVEAFERTGVEMEALTTVCIALLNIWDAVKMYEKTPDGQYPDTLITDIRVVRKVKNDEVD